MSVKRHLRWTLATAAAFAIVGLTLEILLAFRVSGFADDPIRRDFLRLGHAHGVTIALANLGLAWALERLKTPPRFAGPIRTVSWLSAWFVGLGFAGGGLWHAAQDPGPLVLLVPAGALMLISALLLSALRPPLDP